MKRKLQFLGAAAITVLLSAQMGFAQTGGAYDPANPTVAGAPWTVGALIEFEYFDLGANANLTVNPTGVAPFGYSDASALNTGTAGFRTNTDVDISPTGNPVPTGGGYDVVGFVNSEYLYYTVNFATSGSYRLDVFYKHASVTGKLLAYQILKQSDLSAVSAVISSNLPKEQAWVARPTGVVDVCAGTYVLKVAFTGGAGPVYDSFTIVQDGALVNPAYCSLGVNDFDASAKELVAYPNGNTTGIFTLNIDSAWDVYSLSGAKVISGNGTNVDISGFSKGVYLLKTNKGESLKLMFN